MLTEREIDLTKQIAKKRFREFRTKAEDESLLQPSSEGKRKKTLNNRAYRHARFLVSNNRITQPIICCEYSNQFTGSMYCFMISRFTPSIVNKTKSPSNSLTGFTCPIIVPFDN